ncbi:GH39 family glycosyl hydrolase [Kosmotoga olearia]|uniref:Glycosyl hydrolases family 39 N-terminal catalytic domain-containing protein n=1 Tax=Kosmotoga olearia (strain ATCC BAA-1733 / DSM 21960 / TBF 19.5.1) TaxID=521045 RepID=C5CIK9_KOSOT|nr:glycosyl hydrolase [Kosmotoga olearia]ACR79894.1 hypothetical protein Kole_1195 [Kosmotoga olearia TBF 19.5.1]MDK2953723.1 hypothetical protein [Kosmotoga sp.]
MVFRRLILLVFIIFSVGGYATEIVVENPAGFSFYSLIHYDAAKELEIRKDIIIIPGKSPNPVVYSKAWVENGKVAKLKLERRFDSSSSFKDLVLIDGGYLSQEQVDHIILPADFLRTSPINSFQFLKENTASRKDRFTYNELDPFSGKVLEFEYDYENEITVDTEIGKVNVGVYRMKVKSMGLEGEYSFDTSGEPVVGKFMGSTIYNLKYFPSKKIAVKFDYESKEISPYLFGNNYWSEAYIKQTLGFVRNSAIEMIRWGGIYRDKEKRRPNDFELFKKFIDYTSVVPLIQLGYFTDEPVEEQLEKVLAFIPETEFVSFSNEANIYPVIMGKNVSVEEFNSRYRSGVSKIKERAPFIKIVGPDFTIGNLPQYDSWLKKFLEKNGDLIDIFSIHYYPFDGSQSAERTLENIEEFPVYIDQLRKLLGKYGLEDIPIAITECNTSYDFNSSGPGNASTFEAALWAAAAFITGIEKELWSIQLWGIVNDGTLSLLNIEDGYTDFKPTTRVYSVFKDFSDRYIPVENKVSKLKIVFSPNEDLGVIVAVVVNYDSSPKELLLRKIDNGISVEPMEGGIKIEGLSITLLYLNEKLEVVYRKDYTK